MRAVVLRAPGGLNQLELRDLPDPGQPGVGQIRVAIHATSLNFHDLLVANGSIPTTDGRILMSDGAGVVEAVGEGVTEFAVGESGLCCLIQREAMPTPSCLILKRYTEFQAYQAL
jgi:NADPH:quinone reductase-like Zn-dependent oxidoreductase